ncbi:MAG: RsmB/NOP family class I SAM-dependent RNA methyltransferase [Rhodobacteraceae bacterium]|nr:RsmB/NOP family class I SAM-dependent RNA methyltransferase [Paracoccaceae bacterium]
MTPAARAAAAIAVLDGILAGDSAEHALTGWARAARYAGSGDRAAVRDLVFQALRRRRSAAALGGGDTGRGLILGLARAAGEAGWFAGAPHGPAPERPDEVGRVPAGDEALDVPDWLSPRLRAALGADYAAVMQAMRDRAPVVLRANAARIGRDEAIARLAGEGIAARPHPLADFALEVTEGARKIQHSACFASGLVELQDAASQAVVQALPLADGLRVLDLCAGGGGKTLAMAARARLSLWAHDATPRRMADLPLRATRAGVSVILTDSPEAAAPYDLILTDVPCSGSGSWRRDPEGKWALTPGRLAELAGVQDGILARAATLAPRIAYATCSFLREENEDRIAAFLSAHPDWRLQGEHRFTPLDGGDGFYLAILQQL